MTGRGGGSALLLVLSIPLLSACSADAEAGPVRELRVCSDPNNLPFSDSSDAGFENEIARLVADELNAELSYTWRPQRRGFIRNTLGDDRCDVVMGVPSSMELALPTRPYYRSTYVFLSRSDRQLDIRSLDDPALAELTVGIHLMGDDYNNSPAAAALAKRGMRDNLVGYSIYGDYSQESPPARLVKAVAEEEVDLAIVWGPLAGYFAARQGVEMEMSPVTPQIDLPFVPFVYDISMAVARSDTALKEELDAVLNRRQEDVDAILRSYGVPILANGAGGPRTP